MEEERVVRLGARDEPLHGLEHVGSRRDLARIPRVVREHDDVVGLVMVALCERVRESSGKTRSNQRRGGSENVRVTGIRGGESLYKLLAWRLRGKATHR